MKKFNELIADLEKLGPTSQEIPVKAAETSIGNIVNVMGSLGCMTPDGDSIVSWTDQWGQRLWEPKPQGNFFEEKILPVVMQSIERVERQAFEECGSIAKVLPPIAQIRTRSATRMFLENSVAIGVLLNTEVFNDERTTTCFARGEDSQLTLKEWAGIQFKVPHDGRDLRIGVRRHSNSANDVNLRW